MDALSPARPVDALSLARPVDELDSALAQFRAVLTVEQRHDLSKIRTIPDADSILVFTAQLDNANRSRRGQSVGSRVSKVLHSTRDFCAIIDTFVSSHPEIAAVVWGSVKLTMQIVVNYASYYEAVSGLFMRLGHLCPLFAEYRTLYQSSKHLQKSLSDFHASIVRCCKHVVEALQRPWHSQVFQAFYRSFDQEFQPDTDDILKCSDRVKDAINLAKAHIDAQEQKLQCEERGAALENRNLFKAFASRAGTNNDKLHELLLRREERETQDRQQRLLEALCAHRPERLLKQNQRKRFGNTASWIFETTEFCNWIDRSGPPLLWCSGKIGSGKTVVATSVIDYFFLEKGRSDCLVSYFFIHSSDRESLNVETVLRSILRQRLPVSTQLTHETEARLRNLNEDNSLDKVVEFLRDITYISKPSYIVIDGLDECDKTDRYRVLGALSSLVVTATNTKLFLAGRESLAGEIQKYFPSFEQISMDNPGAQHDMITYVNGILQRKIDGQELIVGDPGLITEIEQALNQGADGMFLWVFFQVHDLCEQTCDEDIRQTIANLPQDLEETFNRVLRRIASRSHMRLARRAFTWIAASARPLSLEELREAIAIEIGQPYSIPERLCNNVNTIILSCENLVHVDEEDRSIQFAHHTIKQFLVQQPVPLQHRFDHDIQAFFIDLEDVDHFIGEICVTYLHFNDFKTGLSRQETPISLPSPSGIAVTALSSKLNMTSKLVGRFSSRGSSTSIKIGSVIKSSTNNSKSTYQAIYNTHPFLNYASTSWILHTKNFQDGKSKTWNLWKSIIIDGHDLAMKPWPYKASNMNTHAMKWARRAKHIALICHIILSYENLIAGVIRFIIDTIHDDNNIHLIKALMQHQKLHQTIHNILPEAAKVGNLNIVEILLAAQADIHATNEDGQNALHTAAFNGYSHIVETLLAAHANVNATDNEGQTAFYIAAFCGHFDVVEKLLTAQSDVNAIDSDGWNALHIAASCGHSKIVERLLVVQDNVNATDFGGQTALHIAAFCGHSSVVERLVAAQIDVNATDSEGQTALHIAAFCGHSNIVERLLKAQADINATDSEGRTAFQVAVDEGNLEVAIRLR